MAGTAATADILVVGAGMAGLAAALRAAELGLRPRLFEARSEERYPCNTRWGGGVLHLAFRSMRAAPEELARAIVEVTGGFVQPELAGMLADNAARSVDWLGGKGIGFGAIQPTEGWRDTILEPLGYHDRPRLVWEGRGSDKAMGILEAALAKAGVRIERGRRAQSLLMRDRSCVGLRLDDGEEIEARAVVLADGGFQGSPELLRDYITPYPERLRQRGPGTSPGDGIRMAREAGADFIGMNRFYGHILSIDSRHNDDLWPFPFLDFLAASGALVDRTGRRFTNEGRSGVAMANAVAAHPDADPAYAIFDAPIWEGAGRHFFAPPNPNLVKYDGTLHIADDIPTLAERAGLPVDALRETVARHNRAVDSGDLQGLPVPRTDPKGAIRPIATGPFYAAPGCAAITHTMGGVRIDTQTRVLTPAFAPIAGLYAAGNVTGGFDGGDRVAYVGGLAIALIQGLLAAEAAAGRPA